MSNKGRATNDAQNILIASTAPLWQVKIADFGISKQAFQGVTRQYTVNMFGTMGYAAPEALGYYDDNDETITYTMSVDIWAVGTIALTLMLGREVFPRPGDLARYVSRQRPLDFSLQEGELTADCRDFITRMLAPDPVVRPTAISALAHPWLKQAATLPPSEDAGMPDAQQPSAGDNSSVQDEPRVKQEPEPDDKTRVLYHQQHLQIRPATEPEIKQETKDDVKLRLYPERDPVALQRIHKFLSLDSALLTPKLRGLLFDKVISEQANSLLCSR
jgi:serine/threonine protein kinase